MAVLFRQVLELEPLMRSRNLSLLNPSSILVLQFAGKKYKYFPDRELNPPPKFENINVPSKYRLPMMPKTPNVWQAGKVLFLLL